MIKKIQVIIIFLFVGISTKFFDARFLDPSILNYVVYVSFIILIGITIPYVAPKSLGFVLPVQLIVISIFFSLLMAYISWDQSFNNSVIQTLPFMVWIVFFYLLHAKVPVKSIETIILIYGVLYTALYFFQFLNAPKIYFGQSLWGDEFTVDRGTVRIIFPGATIFVLAVFMSLNKLTTQIRGRWIWLIFLVLGIVVPVLQVTRQFIAGILLIYIYHFLRNQTVFRKAIVMISFIGMIAVVASSDNALIKGLTEASANDSKQGEKYIRVVSAKYFLTDFSPNDLSTFFGNGSPYTGISSYGKFEQKLQEKGIFFGRCWNHSDVRHLRSLIYYCLYLNMV